MKYELFDPSKNLVADREVALAFDRSGVAGVALAGIAERFPRAVALAESRGDEIRYPCAMRSLVPGEHDIGWGEKLRVMPEDVAMCVVNGNALAQGKDSFFPLLFDHAFSGRGSDSPGDVLECYEEGGALWHLIDLADEEMYRAACKPGKRWKSRSLGFGAWIDGDGMIRPVQPRELSLTNLPRLKGLGKVVEMSQLRKAFGIGFGPGHAGLTVPLSLVVAPSAPPEGAEKAAAGDEGFSLSTPTPSPDSASNRKEEHMKVSPETLKLLGLAPDASEDDLNRRLAEVAATAVPKPDVKPADPAPAPAAPGVSLADVQSLVEAATQKTFAALAEQSANAAAEAAAAATKKARVDAVLDKGYRMGRLLKDDLELLRPSVETNPDAFEARLASMPKVAPVQDDRLEAGGTPTDLSDSDGYTTLSKRLTYAAQYARAHNITLSEAQAQIAALSAN